MPATGAMRTKTRATVPPTIGSRPEVLAQAAEQRRHAGQSGERVGAEQRPERVGVERSRLTPGQVRRVGLVGGGGRRFRATCAQRGATIRCRAGGRLFAPVGQPRRAARRSGRDPMGGPTGASGDGASAWGGPGRSPLPAIAPRASWYDASRAAMDPTVSSCSGVNEPPPGPMTQRRSGRSPPRSSPPGPRPLRPGGRCPERGPWAGAARGRSRSPRPRGARPTGGGPASSPACPPTRRRDRRTRR